MEARGGPHPAAAVFPKKQPTISIGVEVGWGADMVLK